MSDKSSKRKGYRHVGIRVRLDKRRSARQRVMRMLATGKRNGQQPATEKPEENGDLDGIDETPDDATLDAGGAPGAQPKPVRKRFPFHQGDLRYKHIETDTREES